MGNSPHGGTARRSTTAERAAIATLVALFGVTVAWWALALWPVSDVPSEWLTRARAVCFNAGPNGIPDASGWMLLIGQPVGMFAVLMVFAGDAVRGGVARLRASGTGRAALATAVLVLVAGLGAAFVRVGSARAADALVMSGEMPAPNYPRLDREAPALDLVDQHGEPATLARFRGRPVLMTFAFGHCEAICPMVVHETRRAQSRLREDGLDVAMVVVTLDPWRDTPARLSHLSQQWELSEDGFALSGDVDRVNGMLDAWEVARERDEATGDIAHPALVFVLNRDGAIAYASSGGARMLEELVRRL